MAKMTRIAVLAMMAAALSARAETTDARCAPHFDDSRRLDGYRCEKIQPGSRYDRLGLRDGDLIRAVDGARLEDPLTALEKLGRLSSSRSRIALVLERDGQEISRELDPDSAEPSRAPAAKKQVTP